MRSALLLIGLMAMGRPGVRGAVPALSGGTILATPGDGQVEISLLSNPGGGSGAISSTLYRHTSSFTPPGTGTSLGAISIGSPVTDTGRANGTTYYYRVYHVDASSSTAVSAQVTAVPASDANPYPNRPAGVWTAIIADDMSTLWDYGKGTQETVTGPSGASQLVNRANWAIGDGDLGQGTGPYGGISKYYMPGASGPWGSWASGYRPRVWYASWKIKFSANRQFNNTDEKIGLWFGFRIDGPDDTANTASMLVTAASAGLHNCPRLAQQYPPGSPTARNWNPSAGSQYAVDQWLQVEAVFNSVAATHVAKLFVNNVLRVNAVGGTDMDQSGGGALNLGTVGLSGVRLEPYYGGQGGGLKTVADYTDIAELVVFGADS